MPIKSGSQFWFKSPFFAIEQDEDLATNPRCFGRTLANWLREKLIVAGYSVEEVTSEEWGWCVLCMRKPYMLWVGCVSVHDYNELEGGQVVPLGKEVVWTCAVIAEQSLLSSLFSRSDIFEFLAKLSKQVENILYAEPQIIFTEQP